MLSCRNGPRLRWFALLGLVLLGVVAANGVWAASTSGSSLTYTQNSTVNQISADEIKFPYLSVNTQQANMLANAFMFQMSLFTGASGTVGDHATAGGGFAAVRYLALMAVMVGTLLIIFFKKYQRVAVILPWFLLVIITVFVPLGSKILFYPIKVTLPKQLSNAGMTDLVHSGDKPCTENPQGCGFTPQLVAVHLGTTLQMIVSDIFRSTQWSGLLERQAAAAQMYQYADFDMGPGWLRYGVLFGQTCGDLPLRYVMPKLETAVDAGNPKIKAMMAGPVAGGPARSLSDMIEEYHQVYFNNAATDPSNLPPMIVLPQTKTFMDTLGWDDTRQKTYAAAIGTMCKNNPFGGKVLSTNCDSGVTVDGAGGTMKVKDAVDNMYFLYTQATADDSLFSWKSYFSAGFAGAYTPLSMMFMRESDLIDGGASTVLDSRKCYVRPKMGTGVEMGIADYITAITAPAVAGASALVNSGVMSGPSLCPTETLLSLSSSYPALTSPWKQRDEFLAFYKRIHGDTTVELDGQWNQLANLYSDDAVKNMPVAYGVPQFGLTGVPTLEDGSERGFSPVYVKTAAGSPTCESVGKRLVRDAIYALSSNESAGKQSDKYFDNLVKMLDGTTTTVPEKLTWSDVTSQPLNGFPDSKNDLVNNVISFLNEEMRTDRVRRYGLEGANVDDDDRREAMMRGLLGVMERVSAQVANVRSTSGAAAATDEDSKTVKIVGNETLSGVGGWMATFMAQDVLTPILAFFTGPLAVAFIYFLNILIDMTLMALIVLTPFLFIMGLLIPTAAAGVLMISVMSVLVLKFVPVTIIILNALGGMMYDLLPVSLGTNADFARDLLVIAMSGMYMSAVGLTFFLMFKLGDPAAFLGRLVALDAASKKIADSGWDATKVLAGAAVAIAAGAATGGVAGGMAALRQRAAQAGVPSELLNVPSGPPVETKKKGEGGEGGEDGDKDGDPNAQPGDKPQDPNAPGGVDADGNPIGDALGSDTGLSAEEETGLRNAKNADGAGTQLQEFIKTGRPGESHEFKRADGSTFEAVMNKDGSVTADGVNLTATSAQRVGAASAGSAGGSGDSGPVMDRSAREQATEAARTQSGSAIENIPQGDANAPAPAAADGRMDAAARQRQQQQEQQQRNSQQPRVVGGMQQQQQQPQANAGGAQAGQTQPQPNASVGGGAAPTGLQQQVTAAHMERISQRIAAQQAENDQLLQNPNLSSNQRASIEGEQERLKEMLNKGYDEADLAQGGIAKMNGSLDEMQRARMLRGLADSAPKSWAGALASGAAKGFLSGAYGSVTGVFASGGGSIPLVGPAMREIANEWYQAPERARGVKMAGGIGKWMQAKGDAERLKFFNQEAAPMVSGFQYQQMMGAGAFQGQYEVAKQAASETVAKTRSNYTALLEAGGVKAAFGAESLAGLGSIDAAARLGAVMGEARLTQGATVEVRVAETDKNGRLTGNVKKEKVVMTPKLLAEMQGNLGVKAAGGKVNDMLLSHMSIAEKMYSRDNAEWNSTRGMAQDGAKARQFAMKDIDSDYVADARIKMFEGKSKNFENLAYAKAIVDGLQSDNAVKLQVKKDMDLQIQRAGGAQQAYEAEIRANPTLARLAVKDDDYTVNFSKSLDAVKMEEVRGKLKVQPIFEASSQKGHFAFQTKSALAQFKDSEAEFVETVGKAALASARLSGAPQFLFKGRTVRSADGSRQMQMDSVLNEYMSAISNRLKTTQPTMSSQDRAVLAAQMTDALVKNYTGVSQLFDQKAGAYTDGNNRVHADKTYSYFAKRDKVTDAIQELRADKNVPQNVKDHLEMLKNIGDENDGRFKFGDPDSSEEGLIFNN